MKVYIVEEEDLTHLGGPMGSEYTTSMGTKAFGTKEAVIEYLKAETGGMCCPKDICNNERKQSVFDCGSVGYIVNEQEI